VSFRNQPPRKRTAEDQKRKLRSRILIVCGGQRTEKDYFHGLRDAHKSANVTIKVHGDSGAPLGVVRKAAELSSGDADAFDECWAVFDVDDFDVTEALTEARQLGVNVAVSNPCFEYWLLLHFCEHRSHISTKQVAIKLSKCLPSYDKTRLRFRDFSKGASEATRRAKEGCAHDKKVGNPGTHVWRIVEKFLDAA
jgi:hypothetical protein